MEAHWFGRIITRELGSLRKEIEAYPDDQAIWREVPGIVNSAGTLTLHLCGNLQHFIGAELGDTGYVRDRPSEFSRRGVSRDELLREIDAAIAAVDRTLGKDRELDWSARHPRPVGGNYTVVLGDWLVHLVSHLSYHLGQVDYHRRMVTGDSASLDIVSTKGLATAVKADK